MKMKIKKNNVLFSFSKSDSDRKNFICFSDFHKMNTILKKREIQKNIVKLFNQCKALPKETVDRFNLGNAQLKDDFSFDFANSNFGQYLNITKPKMGEHGFWIGFDFDKNIPQALRSEENLYFGVSSTKLSSKVTSNSFSINTYSFQKNTSKNNGNATDWFYTSFNIVLLNNNSKFIAELTDLIDDIRNQYSLF